MNRNKEHLCLQDYSDELEKDMRSLYDSLSEKIAMQEAKNLCHGGTVQLHCCDGKTIRKGIKEACQ